jgi:uncharacterized protein YlxW (UPF0749 family)
MNIKATHLVISAMTMILGIMLAVQFRSNQYFDTGASADRAHDLLSELSRLEKDNRKLDREIGDLAYKLEQARKGQFQALEAIRDELLKARLKAGLTAVTGPGIEVVLEDLAVRSSPNDLFELWDEYLLRMVNELRGAGAEAIAINGERLISTSEIRMAGDFVNINLEKTVPPYHILVIGNPDKLRSALEIRGGLADYLKDMGIGVKIQPRNDLTVPGYGKELRFFYTTNKKAG